MTRDEARKAAEVMLAYANGAEIELVFRSFPDDEPMYYNGHFGFNWIDFCYRIKTSKPSIDWSAVSDEFKFLVVDANGNGVLSSVKPELSNHNTWLTYGSTFASARGFSSFNPGNCDWKDSLVTRPV